MRDVVGVRAGNVVIVDRARYRACVRDFEAPSKETARDSMLHFDGGKLYVVFYLELVEERRGGRSCAPETLQTEADGRVRFDELAHQEREVLTLFLAVAFYLLARELVEVGALVLHAHHAFKLVSGRNLPIEERRRKLRLKEAKHVPDRYRVGDLDVAVKARVPLDAPNHESSPEIGESVAPPINRTLANTAALLYVLPLFRTIEKVKMLVREVRQDFREVVANREPENTLYAKAKKKIEAFGRPEAHPVPNFALERSVFVDRGEVRIAVRKASFALPVNRDDGFVVRVGGWEPKRAGRAVRGALPGGSRELCGVGARGRGERRDGGATALSMAFRREAARKAVPEAGARGAFGGGVWGVGAPRLPMGGREERT